ncbi:MAG: hypothetical protein M3Y42_10075 [Actinomycetota bacterium]|nr:hypothetical protein [Actinomycetota bacterium]
MLAALTCLVVGLILQLTGQRLAGSLVILVGGCISLAVSLRSRAANRDELGS